MSIIYSFFYLHKKMPQSHFDILLINLTADDVAKNITGISFHKNIS